MYIKAIMNDLCTVKKKKARMKIYASIEKTFQQFHFTDEMLQQKVSNLLRTNCLFT